MNLQKFIKPVEWTSHGKARLPKSEMEKAVTGLISTQYGIPKDDVLPLVQMYDWSSFYRPDGAKVTKSLQTVVRKFKTKEETAVHFPDLGRTTTELYEPSSTYTASFAEKSLIGEGVLESKKTCFADGNMNGHNKHFIVLNRRMGVLKIEDKERRGVARCLVFFGGYRNVFLFNFYFNGVNQNKHLFIEAYRRIMKLKKVMYKETEQGGFFLPLYRNTRNAMSSPIPALHLYDEKSRFPKIIRKMPCPYCRKEVLETELWSDMGQTEKYGACSRACFMQASGRSSRCPICGKDFSKATGYEVFNEHDEIIKVCRSCGINTFQSCVKCTRWYHKDRLSEDSEGFFLCSRCLRGINPCAVCGGKFYQRSYSNVSTPQGLKRMCDICAHDHIPRCDVCRGGWSNSYKTTEIDGAQMRICPTCREIYKGFRIGKEVAL